MFFSPYDCTIQRWISPVVSTCNEVLGTTVSQFFCNSGLRAMRRNPKSDWNYPVLPYSFVGRIACQARKSSPRRFLRRQSGSRVPRPRYSADGSLFRWRFHLAATPNQAPLISNAERIRAHDEPLAASSLQI